MDIRDRILETEDRPLVPVEVPEWGIPSGEAFVRGMTPADYIAWRINNQDEFRELNRAGPRALADVVVRTLVGKDGERILRDEDVELVLRKRGDTVLRLSDAALAAGGLEEGPELEEAVGNSNESPTSA